jgi:small subunit ribosomal protein S3
MLGVPVHVNIEEIRKPEVDAQLIADSITQQLEKRIMFRRAMKRAMQNAMRLGAQGIKIMSPGRLNGIEIARTEWYREGRVPLHTLRADIDYGFSKPRRPTASSASRSGSTRATRWVAASAPRRPTPRRRRARTAASAPRAAVRAPGRGRPKAPAACPQDGGYGCQAAAPPVAPKDDGQAGRQARAQGRGKEARTAPPNGE